MSSRYRYRSALYGTSRVTLTHPPQAMKRRRHGLERILMVSSWNATGLSAMRTELTNLMVGAREAPPATKPEHKPTSLLPDYEAYEPSEERPSRQQHQNRLPSRERRSTQPTGYNRAAGSGGASRGRGGGGAKGPQERSARGGESASRYNRSSGSPTASRGTRGGRGRGGGGGAVRR